MWRAPLTIFLETTAFPQTSDSSFHSCSWPVSTQSTRPWRQESWWTGAPLGEPRSSSPIAKVEGRKSISCSCWGFPEQPGRGSWGRERALAPLSLIYSLTCLDPQFFRQPSWRRRLNVLLSLGAISRSLLDLASPCVPGRGDSGCGVRGSEGPLPHFLPPRVPYWMLNCPPLEGCFLVTEQITVKLLLSFWKGFPIPTPPPHLTWFPSSPSFLGLGFCEGELGRGNKGS